MDQLLRSLWDLGGPSAACSFLPGCSILSPVVCNPVFWFLQFQSSMTMLGIGLAWLWASQSRVRESRRIKAAQKAGNPLAFVNSNVSTLSHEKQRQLPMVSVILAVKGASEQALSNWRSQLVTHYGGPLEYIFCVESKDDPAYAAVEMLQKEMQGVCNVRLVVAGLASSCSQQIHNQMAGAEAVAEDSKFLLFLDDDIQVHPGTIGSLVDALEQRPEVFVCTGYSFDVPSTRNLAAYAAMAYRLPLLIGMSSGGPCFFVWGGCIMLRTADLRTNRHGVHTALKKNGYSNDLILTSVAGLNSRAVWCPATALFPGRMSGEWTFTRYWNYVRRQIFALLTYCNSYAYRTNRTGWVIYSYLALGLVLPLIPSMLHVAYSLGMLSSSVLAALGSPHPMRALSSALTLSAIAGDSLCPIGLALAWAQFASLLLCTLMCVRLFFAAITLCNLLSPEKKHIDIRSLSILYGVGGFLLNLSCLPIIAVYTWLRKDITWAGIRYVRRHGVVAKVEHPHQQQQHHHHQQQQQQQRIFSGAAAEDQEMVALAEPDESLEGTQSLSRSGSSKGSVSELMNSKSFKDDVENQLVQGESFKTDNDLDDDVYSSEVEKRFVYGVFSKAGVFDQVGAWLKALPLLGRTLSPMRKKM